MCLRYWMLTTRWCRSLMITLKKKGRWWWWTQNSITNISCLVNSHFKFTSLLIQSVIQPTKRILTYFYLYIQEENDDCHNVIGKLGKSKFDKRESSVKWLGFSSHFLNSIKLIGLDIQINYKYNEIRWKQILESSIEFLLSCQPGKARDEKQSIYSTYICFSSSRKIHFLSEMNIIICGMRKVEVVICGENKVELEVLVWEKNRETRLLTCLQNTAKVKCVF